MTSQKTVRVFVSHSVEDVELTRRLVRALEAEDTDVTCWLAEDHIRPGDSIVDTIAKAVDASNAVILVLSKQTKDSRWVRYELQGLQKLDRSRIIVVRADDSEIPSDLAGFNIVDVGGDLALAAARVASQLQALKGEAKPFSPFRSRSPLPPAPASFVGRQQELASLLGAFEDDSTPLIAVVGPAGSGKTSLVRFAVERVSKEEKFEQVVYISVGNYQHADALLSDIVRSFRPGDKYDKDFFSAVNRNQAAESTEALLGLFRQHTLLLVLDGLDELPHGHQSVDQFLAGFGASQGRSKLLVTSRNQQSAGFSAHLYKAFVIQLSDMSQADSLELLFRLGEQHGKSKDDIQRLWHEAQQKGVAVGSPLLLRLLSQNWFEHGTVPNSLADTIRRALDTVSESAGKVLEVLSHLNGPSTVKSISILVPPEQRMSLDATLQELVSSGLLTETEDGRFYFAHKTLKEAAEQQFQSSQAAEEDGVLYITVDPSLMAKEDFVELLDVLNALYVDLGGDELLIRQDEVGHFAGVGVLV